MENSMETPSSSSSPWQPGSAVPNSEEDEGRHLNETMKVRVVVVSSRPPPRPPLPPYIRPLSSGLFECSKCGKELKTRRELSLHINCTVPDAQKPYNCGQCGKGFERKYHLTRHLNAHSGERPFPCATCGMSFFQRAHLTAHSRTHSGTGERHFLCERCGTGFSIKAQLQRHLDTSHGEGVPLPCTKCNKKFRREDSLIMHMKSHAKKPTGEDAASQEAPSSSRESADGNNRSLSSSCSARSKKKLSPQQRPYLCEKCQKGFETLIGLSQHLRTQTHSQGGKGTLLCTVCDKKFDGLPGLKEHSRIHHKNVREFHPDQGAARCSGRSYSSRKLVSVSLNGESKSSNSTTSSPTTAASTSHDARGIGISPLSSEMGRYACNQCGKSFGEWGQLGRHQKTVHSDNRPFGCTLCPSSFKRRDILRLHMKRLHNKPSTSVETGVIANAQNVILQNITLEEKVCLLPLCPYCPALPPPPDARGDDVECQGMSSSSQELNSLSFNDASGSSILTTSSLIQTPSSPVVVLRPPSPLPCSSSSVIVSEARIEEVPFQGLLGCAKTSGKADAEEDLDGDIVDFNESGVARYETVETENHVVENNGEDVPKAVEVGLNDENNSNNSTAPSPTPAPSTPSSSSPVPCCSSSLGSGGSGNIIADKDRVEEPNQGSCVGAGGMLGSQEENDPQVNDVVEAEGVPVEREIAAEIRDENENVEENEGRDNDDIYNPVDFIDDDDNWVLPELNQAPDELSDEPVLTHTHHHRGRNI